MIDKEDERFRYYYSTIYKRHFDEFYTYDQFSVEVKIKIKILKKKVNNSYNLFDYI